MKIAFLKGDGLVDRSIELWTWGPYSHSALVFSDGIFFGSALSGPMHTEFRMIDPNPQYWDFLELNITPEQEKIIRAWCILETGCAYDWMGIVLSQFIPLGYHSKNRWFCSEVCVAALQQIGLLMDKKPNRVSPNKLYRLRTSLPIL